MPQYVTYVVNHSKTGRKKIVMYQLFFTIWLATLSKIFNKFDEYGTVKNFYAGRYTFVEKFHACKVFLIQKILEDDFGTSTQLCQEMIRWFDENYRFSSKHTHFIWIYLLFKRSINRQNYRFWSHQNAHWICTAHTQPTEQENVCAGIINKKILGDTF